MNRADRIYSYPLYSLKRLPKLLRYNKLDANALRKQGGINSAFLTQLDMLWCNLRYGAMGKDYTMFKFWCIPHQQRKTYFTTRKYYSLIKNFDYEVFLRLSEKQNQYVDYAPFIHRKWMLVDGECSKEQIVAFLTEVGVAIAKPASSDCGRGVEKITLKDEDTINRLYANRNSEKYLVEEAVHNCKELDSLNPGSLNTVRVTYIIDKTSQPDIFSVMLRTGATKGAVVDNWGGGGILMDVAVESGVVEKPGLDEQGNEYKVHPITQTSLIGFQIPRYKEMIQFALQVASANPKVVHGGLDIAITDEAFELIEINFPPANIGYQSFGRGYLEELSKVSI